MSKYLGFDKLVKKLAAKPMVGDAKALAAALGKKKSRFQAPIKGVPVMKVRKG
jgi:hypothetical protein